jgi:hypothetical protein
VDVSRPVRFLNLPAKLKDASNSSVPELSYHRKAVQEFHSCRVQVSHLANNNQPVASSTPDSPVASSTPDSLLQAPPSADTAPATSQIKRNISSITGNDGDAEGDDNQLERRMSSPSPKFSVY